MTVKEIIGECLTRLGLVNYISKTSYSTSEQAQIDKLLAALNIIYRGAVAEYLPFFKEESVTLINNEVPLTELGENIIYPMWLKVENCKHKVIGLPNKLKSDFSGTGTLKYAYIPKPLVLDSVISDLRLSPSILSAGALGEYYFENKVFDLAKSFDTDFRSALLASRFKGREMRYFVGR
ncbi:MAG: hypothetical protein RR405_03235 [Clostridia bacterium]